MNTLHQHFKYYESANSNSNSTNSNEYEKEEEKKYTTVVKLSKEQSKALTNSIARARRGENNENSNVFRTYPVRRSKIVPPPLVPTPSPRRGPIPPPPLAKSVTTENKKANESNYNWSSDNNSGSTYTSNGEGGVWRVSRRKPLAQRRLNYAQNIHGLPRPTPSEPPKGGSRKTRRRRRVQNRRR